MDDPAEEMDWHGWDQAHDEASDDLDRTYDLEPIMVDDPSDLVAANRMLRLVARFEREQAQVNRTADADVAVAERWRARELARLGRKLDYLRRCAELWMRAHAQVAKTRTVKLPWGELRLRPARERVEVDVDEFVAAAKLVYSSHGEFPEGWVRVKVEPDKQAIRKAVVAGGTPFAHHDDEFEADRAVDPTTGELVGEGWLSILVPVEPDRFECVARSFEIMDGER